MRFQYPQIYPELEPKLAEELANCAANEGNGRSIRCGRRRSLGFSNVLAAIPQGVPPKFVAVTLEKPVHHLVA
jgi:hypothetical protein